MNKQTNERAQEKAQETDIDPEDHPFTHSEISENHWTASHDTYAKQLWGKNLKHDKV